MGLPWHLTDHNVTKIIQTDAAIPEQANILKKQNRVKMMTSSFFEVV